MKTLLISLMFLAACSSCHPETKTSNPYNDDRGDNAAKDSQTIMDNAVKFEERIKVKTVISSPLEPLADLETVDEDNIEEYVVSGSGVVISSDRSNNTSVILTAWHVCDLYPIGYKVSNAFVTAEVVGSEQLVITNNNKSVKVIEVLYRDKHSDVCAVKVNHAFNRHAELAKEMPPRGASVTVVGAPLGEWGNHLVSTSEGRYFGTTNISVVVGIDDKKPTEMVNFAYYGFAGVGGFSGSGIYYRGKLIGLMTAGSEEYEHASYGPSLDDIAWAVEQSR